MANPGAESMQTQHMVISSYNFSACQGPFLRRKDGRGCHIFYGQLCYSLWLKLFLKVGECDLPPVRFINACMRLSASLQIFKTLTPL